MDLEAEPDSLIGGLIAARYRVEARLGHGAMGTVYRARHVKVGRRFAIKVLHPQFLADDKVRRRFAREAELAGALHHPNIVSVVDAGETPERVRYLVMEYVDGTTLYDLINASAPMPAARVIALVRQLCDGLTHAHERGLIHRDFKTENVIVERDAYGAEVPRIADFGIAILRDEAASSSPHRLTTAGLVLGTPHYMAPEHATGGAIDHRIDLFALGVACFEMLTGVPPFDGDGVDVARANLLVDTPAMSARVPGLEVDPLLEALTRKLMMKSRDARPASARAVRDLIDLIEHDRAAAAEALNPRATVPSRVTRNFAARELISRAVEPVPVAWAPRPTPPEPREPPSLRMAPWVADTEQMAPVRGRRGWLAIAAVAALAALLAVLLALRPDRSGAIVPTVTLPARIAAGLDAGTLDTTPAAPVQQSPEPAPMASAPDSAPVQPARTARGPQLAARSAIALKTTSPAAPVSDPPPPAEPASAAPSPTEAPPTEPSTPHIEPLAPVTPARVAELYASVGKQLKALDQTRGSAATADLWLLYLRVKINDVIANPVKCDEASALLHQLGDETARRSAADP